MRKQADFGHYECGEARTLLGELVRFECVPGSRDEVRAALGKARSVSVPHTKSVLVEHGGYGMYSRYDVKQHKYGGGQGEDGSYAYLEILEIRDPPDGRHGIVIHESGTHLGGGSLFTEWETLGDARKAFEKHWCKGSSKEVAKLPGFKRLVVCGPLAPWFYAMGDEELKGDFALPYGIEDDPVFRFGRKFVVGDDGSVEVKTCLGARFIEREPEDRLYGGSRPRDKERFRIVYWDDGTFLNESLSPKADARPLEDGELWITEAVAKFKEALSGKRTEFSIDFLDGTKFVGKVRQAKARKATSEGRYFLEVLVRGEKKARKGWVDFAPTPEHPDVASFVRDKMEAGGKQTVDRVEVVRSEPAKGGKKWHGAFYRRK